MVMPRKKGKKLKKGVFTWSRFLDVLLVVAFILSVVTLLMALFVPGYFANGLWVIMQLFVISVLFLDMTRSFFVSKGFIDFAKHYWLDFVILIVVVAFVPAAFAMGTGRVFWLIREGKLLAMLSSL